MNTETGGEDAYEAMRDALARSLASGGTIAGMAGMTEDECEALYTLGHGLYEKGRYADALKVLAYLVALNHGEYRYVMALGAAAQALGKYEDALQQYMAAALLEPFEPLAALHGAQCLLELGHHGQVLQSCDLAIAICQQGEPGARDRHGAVLERARALRAAAQARMNQRKPT